MAFEGEKTKTYLQRREELLATQVAAGRTAERRALIESSSPNRTPRGGRGVWAAEAARKGEDNGEGSDQHGEVAESSKYENARLATVACIPKSGMCV